jgi:hypothetical protein
VDSVGDIGRRVELVPMDPHCFEISIGLYRQERAGGPVGLVHTYSSRPEAAGRVAAVARAMAALGGLEAAGEDAVVSFPCGVWHGAAARRVFLEACKADPAAPLAARPLEALDGTSGQRLAVEALGGGYYRVLAAGGEGRAAEVAAGLAKLAELEAADDPAVVSFPCGQGHDALVGLLLVRALNVRATLQEEELRSSRGRLVAPSQQER